jgi:hypothetical protein
MNRGLSTGDFGGVQVGIDILSSYWDLAKGMDQEKWRL